MSKSKMIKRSVCNVIIFVFILFLFAVCAEMFTAPDIALWHLSVLPVAVVSLIYLIYTSMTYYIYYFKHRNDENLPEKRVKGKVEKILSTIFTIIFIIGMLPASLLPLALVTSPADNTKFEEKIGFIVTKDGLSDYSFIVDSEIGTEKTLTMKNQYSLFSMYATKGEITVREDSTQERISTIRFEYAENLPWYVDIGIDNRMVELVSNQEIWDIDGKEYKSVYLEKEIDGLEIKYTYFISGEKNYIDMYINNGDAMLWICEIWEPCIEMDVESRVNEFIEIFKQVSK